MKPKIPTVKVKSDECAINVGQVIEDGEIVVTGTPYYVHEGEWVEILPVITVREVMQISKLQGASNGDTSALGDNLTELCKELSRRVIAWNWTGLTGETLEQPFNRPDVLESLSSEELMWLMSATSQQESADARKKGSSKSDAMFLETPASPSTSQSG
jgi:hypothetical protein